MYMGMLLSSHAKVCSTHIALHSRQSHSLSLSVSLQKDVKKRGDLKTLLVSYYKTT